MNKLKVVIKEEIQENIIKSGTFWKDKNVPNVVFIPLELDSNLNDPGTWILLEIDSEDNSIVGREYNSKREPMDKILRGCVPFTGTITVEVVDLIK